MLTGMRFSPRRFLLPTVMTVLLKSFGMMKGKKIGIGNGSLLIQSMPKDEFEMILLFKIEFT